MRSSIRRVVSFSAPREVEIVEEPLRLPGPEEVRVRTTLSAISPGTERLIYRGNVPDDLPADPSIDALSGGLSYPIRYGYAAVGEVEVVGESVDKGWLGQRVFSFQPHASHFLASPDDLIPLPSSVREEDAVLIPNVETAVNFLMDGRPVVGEQVVVFGQGVVGLLTTALLSRFPIDRLFAVEPSGDRRSQSEEWGANLSFDPQNGIDDLKKALGITSADAQEADGAGYEGADLVFELSGSLSALNDAIDVTGFDSRIIVGSWYGDKETDIDLGGRFHRSRAEVRSSQVSSIDPQFRGRWTKERRMRTVLDLMKELQPGALVDYVFPQRKAEVTYQKLDSEGSEMLQPVFRYE